MIGGELQRLQVSRGFKVPRFTESVVDPNLRVDYFTFSRNISGLNQSVQLILILPKPTEAVI